jgi:hypothetical protein
MSTFLDLLGPIAVVSAVVAIVALVARAVLRLRGTRLVTCPETGRPAAVEVDVRYALVTSLVGISDFRLADCSRWPERAHCGQMCLSELEASPQGCLVKTILARWYLGKRCAYCKKPFGEIHWHDHKPGLLGPGGSFREWSVIQPDAVPTVLHTHEPVCWNCLIAERFRCEHPELVIDRPRAAGAARRNGRAA